MIPRLLGRYRVGELLGAGAFATVHRAHDEQLDAPVAVKLLAHNHAADPDMRMRFVGEGQVLRRIDSAHVVRVHDLAEAEDGRPFLVLELCDSGTLRSRVEEARAAGWRPTDGDVVALSAPLAAAITAISDANAVHRDLTPANILLTSTPQGSTARVAAGLIGSDERVVVTDLGFCKDLARSTGVTATGGTDGFQPPEQRQVGGTVDTRSDIWSAAAVVCWAVTGELVESPGAAVAAMTASGISPDVAAAVGEGLHANPDRRPATAAAWHTGILEAAPGVPPARPAIPSPSPSPGRPANPSSRTPRSAVLAGGLLLAMTIGVVLSMAAGGDSGPLTAQELFSEANAPEVVDQSTSAESAGPSPVSTGPTPEEASPDAVASPTPTDTDELPPDSAFGPSNSGEWSFDMVTLQGWEYRVEVAIEDSYAFEMYEVETDRPGRYRLRTSVDSDATLSWEPITTGRQAPGLVGERIYGVFAGSNPLDPRTDNCAPDRINPREYEVEYACWITVGAPLRTEWRGSSPTLEETVTEVLERLDGRSPDVYFLQIDDCDVYLLLDGRVGRSRSDVCTISGPGTFTFGRTPGSWAEPDSD